MVVFMRELPQCLLRGEPMTRKGALAWHARAFNSDARSTLGNEPIYEFHVVRGNVPDCKGERFGAVGHRRPCFGVLYDGGRTGNPGREARYVHNQKERLQEGKYVRRVSRRIQ